MVKRVDSKGILPGIKSQLRHFLAIDLGQIISSFYASATSFEKWE